MYAIFGGPHYDNHVRRARFITRTMPLNLCVAGNYIAKDERRERKAYQHCRAPQVRYSDVNIVSYGAFLQCRELKPFAALQILF